MFEIKGKVTTAICYAKVVEDEAIEQIKRMCDYDLTKGSKARIMPDVHAGKGCTIGTTMTVTDKICPNIVGVDIGWLHGSFMDDYLHDMEICQQFAKRSRERIAEIIIERTKMTAAEAFHTIHNYIDVDEMILRKGAIAAHVGEKVLIPINMRDGSVLAVGKGNPEWNYSAPHGAGRIMSRTKAKQSIDLEEYKASMQGIYSTSVNADTLDEAPMAYKSLEDIIDVIRESVDIIDIMKPVYNFKASDGEVSWKKKGETNERKDTDSASQD